MWSARVPDAVLLRPAVVDFLQTTTELEGIVGYQSGSGHAAGRASSRTLLRCPTVFSSSFDIRGDGTREPSRRAGRRRQEGRPGCACSTRGCRGLRTFIMLAVNATDVRPPRSAVPG